MNGNREDLIKYVEALQEIQKRSHPDSLEWLKASKEINATAKIIATIH